MLIWAASVSPIFAQTPADSAAMANDPQVLIKTCDKMLETAPHNVEVRLRRAALYQWLGADDKALSDYNIILEDVPNHEEALLFRADIYRKKRDFRNARSDYERLIRLRPDNLNACLGLVITNDADGRPKEAMDQINTLVEAWPEEPLVYLVRGEMFMKRAVYPLALMDFDESIRLDPQNPDAYISRGLYYKRRRKTSKAREDFQSAVALGADADYVYSLLKELR